MLKLHSETKSKSPTTEKNTAVLPQGLFKSYIEFFTTWNIYLTQSIKVQTDPSINYETQIKQF